MNIKTRRSRYATLIMCITLMIAIMFCTFTGITGKDNANAAVISNADVIQTDLMLDKASRGKNSGDYVFNLNAIQELYDKLIDKTGATYSEVETAANAAKSGYTPNTSTTSISNAVVKSIHSGMDSGDIRTKNNSRNIVVKIDGKEWIVTALTTAENNHVILTLMLKDVAYDSKWGNWKPNSMLDFSASYPATMYSTS